jgi:lysophospholipase L1-like esterase
MRKRHMALWVMGGVFTLPVAGIVFEAAWLQWNGTPVLPPDIPRTTATIGSGSPLTYVVMGDSTAVSQGSIYSAGYATATAQHMAANHRVTWVNVAVSGARAADVASVQLQKVSPYKPDIVLIAVGANDVTHLTTTNTVTTYLQATIAALKQANGNVRVVLTGAPDMGSPPRIPQPLRWLA